MNPDTSTAVFDGEKKWDSDDLNGVGVAAVNRALSILEAFTPTKNELSLAELAQHTGLYKSTILRLIDSLEAFGFIHKNDDGMYILGMAPLRLSAIYVANFQPSEVIFAKLRALSKATTESASFYVISNRQRLCAYRIDSKRSIRDHVQMGQLLPLDKGAAGAVLQAFSGGKGKRLDHIRETGFAVSIGERDPEVAAIAAPVFSNGTQLEGALCVSGPASRFADDAIADMKRALLEQAASLTLALGGIAPTFCNSIAQRG